ncbi:hypothetical protein Hanom_Chr11g01013251 [Helianthus anomalus]
MPPTLIDSREVSLILLHRIVTVKGGFEPDDAHVVKVAYIYYIELIEWYFELMIKKGDKNAPEGNEASTKKAPQEAVKREDEPDLVITI